MKGLIDEVMKWAKKNSEPEEVSPAKEDHADLKRDLEDFEDGLACVARDSAQMVMDAATNRAQFEEAKRKAQIEAQAEAQAKMEYDFEHRAIKEIAVCLSAQVPWKGAAGIVLDKIWLFRDVGVQKLKLVIRDPDDKLHAFEGDLEDFHGCRDGDDLMIRALGG